ncbi:hypothetical protein Oter_3731 [Opitutus terrae PB90-1]|uniref:Uncharacterized protein n=2 Tax=Opitutus terrae TaxID=107709 RepID=B1ZYA8_OPITP|nr:hypothetical protein Oter_3731 [Opitutus terrae PB90-1]
MDLIVSSMKPPARILLLVGLLSAWDAIGAAHAPAIPPIPPDSIVRLDPLRVRSRPITCFGLGLRIYVHPQTKQVVRIIVEQVAVDSEAAAKRIAPGTEILKANGRDVRTLCAPFTAGTEFARLFLNRRRGDRIALELLMSPNAKPRQVTLTQGIVAYAPLPWEHWDDQL